MCFEHPQRCCALVGDANHQASTGCRGQPRVAGDSEMIAAARVKHARNQRIRGRAIPTCFG
jgi:hypothetical protein